MYFRDITDEDVVTSELVGGVRDYRVNGQSGVWWKQGEWPSFGERYEALAFLTARDTSRPEDEREKLAAEFWRKAVSHASHHGLPVPSPIPLPAPGPSTDAGPDSEQAVAIKHLVDTQFGGDFTQALLALSSQGDIAVAWMDRDQFAKHFTQRGAVLTDELWERIAPGLDDFDSYAGDPGMSLHADYANQWMRTLGVVADEQD